MEILKQITIKACRKDHECNACLFLTESAIYSDYGVGYNEFTNEERKAIEKARTAKWRVQKNEPAVYTVGKDGGDFWNNWSIPEIHAICCKYDLYRE